jgi:hypothetical protein
MSWDVMARTNHVNRVNSPLRVRTTLHQVSSWHGRAIVSVDLGTAEILATTDQEPLSSKPRENS